MSELALQLIEENKRTKNPYLDLGNCGLTEIPEELFECVWLEKLVLSNEWWDGNKNEEIKSKNRGKENIFSIIPVGIVALQELKELQMSGNYWKLWNIADLTVLASLKGLQKISIRSNQIIDLSPLRNLSGLQCLELSSNKITDLSPLQGLSGLQILELWSNQITDLSPLQGLSGLNSLVLRNNEIIDLSPLQGLSGLIRLELGNNRIADLSPLQGLSELRELELYMNRISDLSPLQKLFNLQKLTLFENEIADLTPLQELNSLQILALKSNPIIDLTPLQGLINLKDLRFGRNNISNLTPLKGLHRLQELLLWNNIITDLTPLKGLKSLKHLELWTNKIVDITPLQGLNSLQSLSLEFNQITDISPLEGLSGLQSLSLGSNQITYLPLAFIEQLPLELVFDDNFRLENGKISLGGNDIRNVPQEVLKQGREFIIQYLKEGQKFPLNECKVIITGRGEAGKTSLQKRLFGEEKFNRHESQTHGIRKRSWEGDVKDVEGQPIKVNFWDMGGQKDQQSLHELFYTDNTLYILLLDKRKDEKPEHFLELIKVYGKGSPVIIVINHKVDLDNNEPPVYDLSPAFDSTLRNKYPNILKVFGVCCGKPNDQGTKELKKFIKKTIPALDFVTKPYPQQWLTIKKQLLEGVQDNYLTIEKYQQLCSDNEVKDDNTQVGLVNMLNDTGAITFFDVPFLRRFILNPDWVTTGAYEIMLSPLPSQNNGMITEANLREIFQKKLTYAYTTEDHAFLMGLMKEFSLCHEKSSTKWLIPSALGDLPKTDLVAYRQGEHRLYKLQYEVHLPDSIIQRFIARNIDNAVNHDYWKNGIVVKHNDNKTLMFVEADSSEREIRLWIKGDNIRDCWEAYRKDFNEFSKGFQKTENVVLDIDKDIMVSYEDLMDLYRNGQEEWYVPKYGKINVLPTLGMFERKIESAILENEKVNIHLEVKPIFSPVISPVFNNTVNLSTSPDFTQLKDTVEGLAQYINDYHTEDMEWKKLATEAVKNLEEMEAAKTRDAQAKAFTKTASTFEQLKKMKDIAAIALLPAEIATKLPKMFDLLEPLKQLIFG